MSHLQQSFTVRFAYNVFFTEKLFSTTNSLLADFLTQQANETRKKILFVIDSGVTATHPNLLSDIKTYFKQHTDVVEPVTDLLVIPGGEVAKNDPALVEQIVDAVDRYGIDRHSYVVAIGGGSVLDMVGYAAAISHRGIRHIRIPTTVLSQNDSGVGVKNSVNYRGKKNFLGTFVPPVAVFNDSQFLTTLDDRDWRAGISEAIKVALIKDTSFFDWIEANAEALAAREMAPMDYLIHRCAEMHLQHIAGGDPFEMGSSRPLDFGHWSAHKLEQLTNFELRHGEAVAIGIALDSLYSQQLGWLTDADTARILKTLRTLGFSLYQPMLDADNSAGVLKGLAEFREHLGGRLTIMLLQRIGKGVEVHEIDAERVRQSIAILKEQEQYVQLA
ncbi:3-dehydroquinate synthase [Spirosoma endbachense]|uniref:3-dehydroquinate synthase n=1 Tax=Spirosoma endbachense TaxID=2666025 RepID=A0A6P1W1Q6_9BACT|nr:3-dehydroquinate synthase [Spirosoma endbachense]QHV98824.1 3-dehydroquinate synthase [Spirosoma endbachense]